LFPGLFVNPLDTVSPLVLGRGAVLTDANTNEVEDLSIPDGQSLANSNIVIDTVAPRVVDVTTDVNSADAEYTPNGTYTTGGKLFIAVVYDKAVDVTGVPTLALNSGGTATYDHGSGTNTLYFTYTVAAGQNAPDLDYVNTNSLTSPGTITQDGLAG